MSSRSTAQKVYFKFAGSDKDFSSKKERHGSDQSDECCKEPEGAAAKRKWLIPL